jgi:dual specificity MAP kinase phosphatase
LPWLKRVVSFITEQRDAGRTTYIHCMNGVNRSAFVTMAYLMAKHGLSRDEAYALVRARRPVIQPNPELMVLLDGWQDALREEAAKAGD